MMSTTKGTSKYSQRKCLPVDYQLHGNDVFCGRGNDCLIHVGNSRFRQIVLSNLKRYNDAQQKNEKSSIIHEVLYYIRSTSPGAGFVTKDIENGRFYEVGDRYAREKTSQAFRDAIQGKYKSNRVRKTQNPMLHDNICSYAQILQPQQDFSQKPVHYLANEVNSPVLNLSQGSTINKHYNITEVHMNESNSFISVSGSVDNHINDLDSYYCKTGETSHVRLCRTTNNMSLSRTIESNEKATSAEILRTSSTNTEATTRTVDRDDEISNDAIVRTSSPSFGVDARTFDLLLEFTEIDKSE